MFPPSRARASVRQAVRACLSRVATHAVALAVTGLVLLSAPAAAFAGDAMLYRIFLRDGSTLVSYGDFARVGDRVVFSIPIGDLDADAPSLQLVSIAESIVDWERTDRYGQAMRARRYAATRGEQDFESLSVAVARALNEVATTRSPELRVALARDVQRVLAAWPKNHYGYRAKDVAELSQLLDDAVAELRVAAGQPRVSLDLVATAGYVPPEEPELPAPTLRESIQQALTVASVTSDPGDRISLWQSVLATLDQIEQPEAWTALLRSKATIDLSAELKTEKAYGDLVTRVVASADERAKRADVGGIESLIKSVLKADDRLGRRRPQVTASLLATLDGRLDAARRLRLARDAWMLRVRTLNDYERRIRSSIERLRRTMTSLEQIKKLAGPSPNTLPALNERLSDVWRDLKLVRPPAEATEVHSVLISACQMAVRAVATRRLAITASDMKAAWEASSAATGALLFIERAQEDLKKLSAPPVL
jgi:hypothetical protein